MSGPTSGAPEVRLLPGAFAHAAPLPRASSSLSLTLLVSLLWSGSLSVRSWPQDGGDQYSLCASLQQDTHVMISFN